MQITHKLAFQSIFCVKLLKIILGVPDRWANPNQPPTSLVGKLNTNSADDQDGLRWNTYVWLLGWLIQRDRTENTKHFSLT